jgi:hypothetical protein
LFIDYSNWSDEELSSNSPKESVGAASDKELPKRSRPTNYCYDEEDDLEDRGKDGDYEFEIISTKENKRNKANSLP